jgi:hypothetical protein
MKVLKARGWEKRNDRKRFRRRAALPWTPNPCKRSDEGGEKDAGHLHKAPAVFAVHPGASLPVGAVPSWYRLKSLVFLAAEAAPFCSVDGLISPGKRVFFVFSEYVLDKGREINIF